MYPNFDLRRLFVELILVGAVIGVLLTVFGSYIWRYVSAHLDVQVLWK